MGNSNNNQENSTLCGNSMSGKSFIYLKTYGIQKDYEILNQLSNSIHLGERKIDKQKVAIQKLLYIPEGEQRVKTIKNEIAILTQVDHPNIIRILDTFVDANFYYIVYEFIPNCQSLEKLFFQEENNTEFKKKQAIFQILKVLCHLEEQNVAHRNLTNKNIVCPITKDSSIDWNNLPLKLISFGFAEKTYGNDLDEIIGTPYFMAPEIIKKLPYGIKCDIWSFGVICYFLLVQDYPFKGQRPFELFSNIAEKNFSKNSKWDNLGDMPKDLISQCLVIDQEQRAKASKLIKHPWFDDLKSMKFENPELMKEISTEVKANIDQMMKASAFQAINLAFMMSLNLNQKDIAELSMKFEQIDTDQNGTLKEDEMKNILKETLGNKDMDKYLKYLKQNADSNGRINYSSFMTLLISKQKLLTETNLKVAFDVLDNDKDGQISVGEFKKTLQAHVGEKTDKFWLKLMEDVDMNKDGTISFDEFKNSMVKLIDMNN